MQTQPVLEIMTNRLHYKQLGEPMPPDGCKLGLAVEGGGMRGIISSGMLMALHDLQILDIFDVYTGTSAGALNMSYLLADQAAMGMSVYFDDLTDPVNLNKRRLFDGDHAMMDIRNMYVTAEQEKRLNIERLVADHADDLFVGVTNVTLNQGELITPREAGDRFFEYLIAGATLPIVAGKPWKIHNNDYYDGGLFYIGPSQAAEQLGCTHVFVLHTMPWNYEMKPWNKLTERILKRLDDDYNNVGTEYIRRVEEYCDVFSYMPYGEAELNRFRMYRHAVRTKSSLGRLTTDREKLMDGAREGYQSILDLFAPHSEAGIIPTII